MHDSRMTRAGMSTARKLLLAGGAMMALLAAGQMPAQAAWTEVKAAANGHFIVNAYINGTRTMAVIDTGATVVAIPYREARRMGLKPHFLKFDQPVWTANGKVRAAKVMLRRVDIDNVVVRNVEGLVMPEGALRHVLIGMSYLGKLRLYAVRASRMRLAN